MKKMAMIAIVAICMSLLISLPMCVHASLSPGFYTNNVPKYGGWELSVTNSNTYTNKFDYTEIELKVVFTSPTNDTYTAYGFHDGDGAGGQTGNVWKARFMPDETGTWSYTYSWQGTGTKPTGGSGTFSCVSSSARGPLVIDTSKNWFWKDSNGNPFHARPYGMHQVGPSIGSSTDWEVNVAADYIDVIDSHVTPRGYNMIMVGSPQTVDTAAHSWWYRSGTDQLDKFNVKAWTEYEKIIKYARDNEVYVFPFHGMVNQSNPSFMTNKLVRYMTARFGAFYNYMGYSPTWEFWELPWTDTQINNWMNLAKDSLPGTHSKQLSIHDTMRASLTSWEKWHMQQNSSNNLVTSNNRSVAADPNLAPYNYPIIGTENTWETDPSYNPYDQPETGPEVCRSAWGQLLAGIMPLYSEWNAFIETAQLGNGEGEPYVRRMFNWWYSKVDYRNPSWDMKNSLFTGGTVRGSGITGQEYVAYRESNGTITINLSSESGTWDVSWFNPFTGTEYNNYTTTTGGASRVLTPPFASSDVVLFVKKQIAGEIIIDNTDAACTFDAAWSTSTWAEGGAFYGSNYAHDGTSGADASKWAKWTPNISSAGNYDIYMRWSAYTNRPDAAPLVIQYNGGTDSSKTVNQQINGGTWVYIGNYSLSAGTGNYVKILSTDTGYTVADAVKFVPGSTPTPSPSPTPSWNVINDDMSSYTSGWGTTGSNGSVTQNSGYVKIVDSGTASYFYMTKNSFTPPTGAFTWEVRAKAAASGTTNEFSVRSGSYLVTLILTYGTSGVAQNVAISPTKTYTLDTTTYHLYRIVVHSNYTYDLYVDGTLRWSGAPNLGSGGNIFKIGGDSYAGTIANIDLDDVKMGTGEITP